MNLQKNHMFIVNRINSFVLGDKQVSVSSLNRHAVATREDVGTSKAQCLKVNLTSCSLAVCIMSSHRLSTTTVRCMCVSHNLLQTMWLFTYVHSLENQTTLEVCT